MSSETLFWIPTPPKLTESRLVLNYLIETVGEFLTVASFIAFFNTVSPFIGVFRKLVAVLRNFGLFGCSLHRVLTMLGNFCGERTKKWKIKCISTLLLSWKANFLSVCSSDSNFDFIRLLRRHWKITHASVLILFLESNRIKHGNAYSFFVIVRRNLTREVTTFAFRDPQLLKYVFDFLISASRTQNTRLHKRESDFEIWNGFENGENFPTTCLDFVLFSKFHWVHCSVSFYTFNFVAKLLHSNFQHDFCFLTLTKC